MGEKSVGVCLGLSKLHTHQMLRFWVMQNTFTASTDLPVIKGTPHAWYVQLTMGMVLLLVCTVCRTLLGLESVMLYGFQLLLVVFFSHYLIVV